MPECGEKGKKTSISGRIAKSFMKQNLDLDFPQRSEAVENLDIS